MKILKILILLCQVAIYESQYMKLTYEGSATAAPEASSKAKRIKIEVHTYMCVYIFIYLYVNIHIYIYTYIHVYIYKHMHIHTYIHIYIYTYTARSRKRSKKSCTLHKSATQKSYTHVPPDLVNHVQIFKGQPRRFSHSELVQACLRVQNISA